MLITVEIPDEVVKGMHLPASDAQAEVRKEIALALYARGLLSIGKATELAGVPRHDFETVLAKRHVERPYDATELERDLAWAKGEK
jgi:predicted HTH domain antitoxin